MWTEKLVEAAYTTAAGDRFTFKYVDWSRSREKRVQEFTFPGVNGSYGQENGHSGYKYPVKAYFVGEDCDDQADAFEAALFENGFGTLEHPMYGFITVVPMGEVTRTDNVTSEANVSTVEVTFLDTLPILYPNVSQDTGSLIFLEISEYSLAASTDLVTKIDLTDPSALASFKSKLTDMVTKFKTAFSGLSELKANIEARVAAITATISDITNFVDGVIDDVTSTISGVIQDVVDLVNLPAQIYGAVTDKLNSYSDLISGFIGSLDPGLSFNDYWGNKNSAENLVTGMVSVVVNSEFDTKSDALAAATTILDTFDDLTAWSDSGAQLVGAIDTGESYQRIQRLVALTVGYLVDLSFSLKQERVVVLDRPRTIIDIAAEYYGSIDDNLDLLINSNSLSGSEILEIPKGRKVKIYV